MPDDDYDWGDAKGFFSILQEEDVIIGTWLLGLQLILITIQRNNNNNDYQSTREGAFSGGVPSSLPD